MLELSGVGVATDGAGGDRKPEEVFGGDLRPGGSPCPSLASVSLIKGQNVNQ